MSPTHALHNASAARARPSCAGVMLALDSGLAPGLVVVDANRPASGAGSAPRLLKQSGVAH